MANSALMDRVPNLPLESAVYH